MLVDRALVFHRLRAEDEMVPWTRVTAVPGDWDRTRLVSFLVRTRHTWVPVVEPRNPAQVLGVIRQTDPHVRPDASIAALITQPARLSPATPLRDAVIALREAQSPVGIVEHNGRAIGLVTIKDLIEPLTGELLEW
jgi:CBS domain containing-hemolysin-like protein